MQLDGAPAEPLKARGSFGPWAKQGGAASKQAGTVCNAWGFLDLGSRRKVRAFNVARLRHLVHLLFLLQAAPNLTQSTVADDVSGKLVEDP